MGPYVFSQIFKRVSVSFEEDGNLMTYRTIYQSDFAPELSNGRIDDPITIINLGWSQMFAV